MGLFFSRFFYNFIEYPLKSVRDGQQKQSQEEAPCCSNSENSAPSVSAADEAKDDSALFRSDDGTLPPNCETPHKVFRKDGVKIFAAFVPDSPERYAFSEFSELKCFLNSPVGKKRGTRFKQCPNEKAVDSFYDEQLQLLSNSMNGMCSTLDEQLLDDSNSSRTSATTNGSSPISVEPELPYKDLPARRLTEFRVAIEKGDAAKFDELLSESPRFIVNTSNDLPTILHMGMRCNAMHVACRSSNVYAVHRLLTLVKSVEWLRDAYGTDACVKERSENLLDAFLNTPDKIENNSPLHYACKHLCEPIFRELIGHEMCHRTPVNSHNERPIDVLGRGARGGAGRQESKKVFDRMYVALEGSLPSIVSHHRRRSSPSRRHQIINADSNDATYASP